MGILAIRCDNSGSGSIFGSLENRGKDKQRKEESALKEDVNNIAIYASDNISDLLYVPGGSFYPVEGLGKIAVSSFYIGKYEITRAEYYNIMEEKPWLIDAYDPYPLSGVYEEEAIERNPATGMNWFEAIVFCNRLSIKENLIPVYTLPGKGTNPKDWGAIPGTYSLETEIAVNASDSASDNDSDIDLDSDSKKIIQDNPVSLWNSIEADWTADGYRLPTEMEFIWAALGGVDTQNRRFSGDNGKNRINDYVWNSANSENNTHPVGQKKPNNLGLFDMTGNVMEWCWDITAITAAIYNELIQDTIKDGVEVEGEVEIEVENDLSLIENEIITIKLPESDQRNYSGITLSYLENIPDSLIIKRAIIDNCWETTKEKSSLAYRKGVFPEGRFPEERDTKRIGFRVARK